MFLARHTGTSMIEILVAIFIVSLGMTGILAMEAYALRMNQESYFRTQAILQVQELADRMHANPVGVKNGAYQATVVARSSSPSRDCLSQSCTPAQLAEFDLWEWNKSSFQYLRDGAGNVSYNHTTEAHTITVSWTEAKAKGQEGTETKSFSFVYKPLPLSLNIAPDGG